MNVYVNVNVFRTLDGITLLNYTFVQVEKIGLMLAPK